MKPLAGSPLRPKKYGCHGQLVVMQGTSLTSAWSATGLVVSGVADARMRSTLSPRISSEATSAARLPLDWLSLADDLHRIGAPAALQAVGQNAAHLLEDEAVGLAEARERTGARADVADLDHAALRVGGDHPQHRRRRDGADERAA